MEPPIHIYEIINNKFLIPEKTRRHAQYAPGIDNVIAVSGAAASGKTSFCRGMVDYLSGKKMSAVHVPLDGYLLDRKSRKSRNLSGYDPQSSDIPAMVDQMQTLLFKGLPIELPMYDHKNGNHRQPHHIEPAQVVILDGIMSFHHDIRERFPNLNIFITGDDIVIRGLRLLVDMEERGYSVFQALRHSDEEFAAYNKWIHPQIALAHLKIRVDKNREFLIEK